MQSSPLAFSGAFAPITRLDTDALKERDGDSLLIHGGGDAVFSLQERIQLAAAAIGAMGIDTSVWEYEGGIVWESLLTRERELLDPRVEEGMSMLHSLGAPFDLNTIGHDSVAAAVAKRLIGTGHHAHSLLHVGTHEAVASRLAGQYPIFVTGGMGAGKSTVARGLLAEAEKYGIDVMYIDLDAVWHRILDTRTDPYAVSIREDLVQTFGTEILNEEKSEFVDRGKLSATLTLNGVPSHPTKMALLNPIAGPAIERSYREMIRGFSGLMLVDGAMKKDDLNPRYFQFSHNNALLIDAPKSARVNRVIDRYAQRQIAKTETDIHGMMSNQPSRSHAEDILRANINKEWHGGILAIENDGREIKYRRELFNILNQVDCYGELRARIALCGIGVDPDEIPSMIRDLQLSYNDSRRSYYTWQRIADGLTDVFHASNTCGLSDEEVCDFAVAVLYRGCVYDENAGYEYDRLASIAKMREVLSKRGVDPARIDRIASYIHD